MNASFQIPFSIGIPAVPEVPLTADSLLYKPVTQCNLRQGGMVLSELLGPGFMAQRAQDLLKASWAFSVSCLPVQHPCAGGWRWRRQRSLPETCVGTTNLFPQSFVSQ